MNIKLYSFSKNQDFANRYSIILHLIFNNKQINKSYFKHTLIKHFTTHSKYCIKVHCLTYSCQHASMGSHIWHYWQHASPVGHIQLYHRAVGITGGLHLTFSESSVSHHWVKFNYPNRWSASSLGHVWLPHQEMGTTCGSHLNIRKFNIRNVT